MTGSVVPPTTISDETVEAAVAAVNDDKLRRMKEQGSFIAVAVSTRDQVGVALLAAVPYIEAGLRAKIAAEIDAERAKYRATSKPVDWTSAGRNQGATFAFHVAARVARGTQEATK